MAYPDRKNNVAWGEIMQRRRFMRASLAVAAGALAVPARAKTQASFASVNTAAYINPRMQLRFIDEVRQKTNG
jgi:hypothetical protein